MIDTNAAAIADTNLYDALLSFADDTNTAPTLQILLYRTNAVLIRANRFDYSAETDRDFALLVGDKVETPTWKSIDFTGASDSQDGWLIQGLVPHEKVADPNQRVTTARAAEFFDQTWVCGPNQWPGACDPTYSAYWAGLATLGQYPQVQKFGAFIYGFRDTPYSSVYDDEIMTLDTSHVKN